MTINQNLVKNNPILNKYFQKAKKKLDSSITPHFKGKVWNF